MRRLDRQDVAFLQQLPALGLRQEQLAEKVELTVLDQSVYELAHVLKESREFDQGRIDDALSSLEFMHLDIVPYNPDITRKATQIAFEHSISMYAAGFVALGAQLRCQAITSDRELYRKISSLPWTASTPAAVAFVSLVASETM